ncbi:MAG TPA: hypothetical protein VFU47_13530, partial [Armatimonadota bacterium]|nr:hypothetical protein [Armatimonadota bacterium]
MNRAWTMALAVTLAALLPGAALAQGPGRGPGGPGGPGGGPGGGFGFGRMGGRMGGVLLAAPPVQNRLHLSADQKSKIDAIQSKSREEMRGLFQGGGDRQAAFQKMQAMRQ